MDDFNEYDLYIVCYNQPFKVSKKERDLSYPLKKDDYLNAAEQFNTSDIPYRTELDIFEDLPGDKIEIDGYRTCRVIFEINDIEYYVSDWTGLRTNYFFANNIAKALNSKGINSYVEAGKNIKFDIISIFKRINS